MLALIQFEILYILDSYLKLEYWSIKVLIKLIALCGVDNGFLSQGRAKIEGVWEQIPEENIWI
jgi:hypothetical protein